ncbi:hypothetical protein DERP_009776 [Dermatophagoides pteronyssinus]|uniref:Uncharacterized protein n=1 Tax=Dermatophagoides pteronyssinus TaxID=6956 RepID=A0ABQ8IR87_DERPT|nr:hypothetical protein DERP_009776 [Dermatophagoides pteronyssinus]
MKFEKRKRACFSNNNTYIVYNIVLNFPITNNYAESHNHMTNFIAIIKQLLNFGDYDIQTGYIIFKKNRICEEK